MKIRCPQAYVLLALAVGAGGEGSDGGVSFSGCFLGATRCCGAAPAAPQACCRRAAQDCGRPQAPLLLVANWPAALGNALIELHDAVLLARALGRALLLPPVLGEPPALELEALADAFAIDIVVTDRFSWDSTCSTASGGVSKEPVIFEVSGGARVGPYRDQQRAMADGDMPLPHELLETPKVRGDGIWSYELRGTAALSQSGKWWGVKFPHQIQLMYWEVLMSSPSGRLPEACDVSGGGDPASQFTDIDPQGHASEQEHLPLPPEWVGDQLMKQHPCLVPLLTDPRRPPASQRCLVLAQLFNSVHWDLHREDHLRFFQHLRFAADIRSAAAEITSPRSLASTALANHAVESLVGVLSQPYVAVHVRTFILFEDGGAPKCNLSAAEAGFSRELLRAVRAVRRRYPGGEGPPLFLAADNVEHPLVQRLLRAAEALQGTAAGAPDAAHRLVFTSQDTRAAAGDAPHRHVALDALLCARAAAFVGTSVSSLSGAVAALRRGAGAGAAEAGGGPTRPILTTFWPRRPSVYFDTQVFPTSPWLPSPASINRFFVKMGEEVIGTTSEVSGHECIKEPSGPLHPHHIFLQHAMLGRGSQLTSDQLSSMWWTSLWECPSVAVLIHLQWIVSHLNTSRSVRSRAVEPPWSLERSLQEQAHFIHKVWYLMWMGRFAFNQLAAAELRSSTLELLQRRSGLWTRCSDSEVAVVWDEAPGRPLERSNRGPGDCLLLLEDVGGLPAGTILMDVRSTDFFCPSELPLQGELPGRRLAAQGAPPGLAVRLLQKAASTSALAWAADMEGLGEVHLALASRLRRLGKVGVKEVLDDMNGLGCSKALQEAWSQRLLHFLPRFIGLPPQLCPSRCTGGAGRQKVAVVRNPFKRLASWFSNWIESVTSGEEEHSATSMDRSLHSWADFGRWVARLRPWLQRVQRQHCNGTANQRDWDMWRHLLPMSTVLAGRPACAAGRPAAPGEANAGDYAIIRLETADADIKALEARLCASTGRPCQRLPRLRRHNSGFERVSPPPWDQLWDVATIKHTMQIYGADFQAFGYGPDPRRTAPVGQPSGGGR